MNPRKRNPRQIIISIIVAAYAVMWLGGIGHYVLIGRPPLDAPWAASLFLFLAGLIVLLNVPFRERMWLAAAAVIGFAAEILGVRFGFIFSEYSYTSVLIPQFLKVPLVMLSAWMVLVSYSRQLLLRFEFPAVVESLLAAAWMTAIDLVIDPLAANQLGYWRWEHPGSYYGIPLHNFIGWFAVSLIIFLVIRVRPLPDASSLLVGLSIVLFFTSIALSYGLLIPTAVGAGMAVIHLVTNPLNFSEILPIVRRFQPRER